MKKLALILLAYSTISGCTNKFDKHTISSAVSESISSLNFEDQKTHQGEILKTLGNPKKVVSFAHRVNLQYILDGKNYCFYLDGSGLIWATDPNPCSIKETYLPQKSLTSHLPDKGVIL